MTTSTSGVAVGNGRYLLGEVLGVGGMARVVRATDTVLGRQVAVKLFRNDLDHDSAARAQREMHTLAGLAHPGLVSVYDAGTETGEDGSERFWIVMELVDGPTLAGAVLTPERVAGVGTQVALALAHVHAAGIVHRDVKPANILLAPDGSARLADFGIARIVDDARHTGTGLTIGTAPYLAPEQVTGSGVGPPADVYALGLVLLEALTGHREYDGGQVETAMARLHRQPVVPAELPAPWPALLTRMTSLAAAQRPSAAEVAQSLRPGGDVGLPPTRVAALPPTTVAPAAAPLGAHSADETRLQAASPATRPVPLVARSAATAPRRRAPVTVAVVVLLVLSAAGTLLATRARPSGTPAPAVTPATGPAGSARLGQDLRELRSTVTR